jgi:hypothetical protein
MRNLWVRFGCFLIGYNYSIVRSSSEVAAKSVKRYTSAMIIVCILWAFIGYTFTSRYLAGSTVASMVGAIIAVVIIVQIERQIILSMTHNIGLYIFRGCLALLMAIIGAVIIDQIILKNDIELEKISYIQRRVESLLPSKTMELKNQILALDTTIQAKEKEKEALIEDVSRNPLIKSVSSQSQSIPVTTTRRDSAGNVVTETKLKASTSIQVTSTTNPKQSFIAPLDQQISQMRQQKAQKDSLLLNVRPRLEAEVSSKVGFLDELKVMAGLISTSGVALGVWLLWFLFLLFIEMLVLFSKVGDKANDYERTVLHHMNIQIKKLDVLEKLAERN